MNEIQTKTLYTRAQFPIKTEEEWLELNPVLRKGEIVFVQFFDGMKTAKIGDGKTPFHLLPYVDGPYEELETREFNNNILVNDDSRAETIRIDSFGGMTYKCSNLIKYPYFETTKTINGVTFTDNGDGTITVSGTATGRTDFKFTNGETINLYSGNTYTLGCGFSGGSADTYCVRLQSNAIGTVAVGRTETSQYICSKDSTWALLFRVEAGVTVNNVIVKPMLNVGTTVLPYEPYFKGLQDTKPIEIKIHDANLYNKNLPYTPKKHFSPLTGVYENWGNKWGVTDFIEVVGNTNYTINKSFGTEEGHSCVVFYDKNKNQIGFVGFTSTAATVIITTPVNCKYIRSNLVLANIDEAMLNIGTNSIPYSPYKEPVTIPIPNEILELGDPESPNYKGYGKGISADYCNKVDLKAQTYTDQMHTIELNGTEDWYKNAEAGDYWSFYISKNGLSAPMKEGLIPYICSFLPVEFWNTSKEAEFAWYANTSFGLRVNKTRLPNYANLATDAEKIAAFRNFLAEQNTIGNHVTITYAKADSTVTSIKRPTWSYKVPYGGFVEIVTDNGKTVPATGSLMYIRHRELDTKIEQLEEAIAETNNNIEQLETLLETTNNNLSSEIDNAKDEINSQISYINTRIDNLTSYTQNEFAYIEGILEQFGVLKPFVPKEVSNIIPVPVRSTRYANINSFGGMTRKWEGITYTATANSSYGVYSYGTPFTLQAGTYQLVGGAGLSELRINDTIVNNPFTLETDTTINSFYEESGAVVGDGSTHTIYPYLLNVDTNKAIAFPNTWLGLQDTKPTEIKIHGANLIPLSFFNGANYTHNGITYTDNKDGSITINGTTGEIASSVILLRKPFLIGDYTLSANNEDFVKGLSLFVARYTNRGWVNNINSVTQTKGYFSFDWTEEDASQYVLVINIHIMPNTTVNNIVLKPMLNMGTTAVPYTPYKNPETFSIHDEIQNLSNYGKGVSVDYCNKVDSETQTYAEQMETMILTSKQTWWDYGAASSDWTLTNLHCYAIPFNNKKTAYSSSVCSHFKNVDRAFDQNIAQNGYYTDHNSVGYCYFVTDKDFTTFKMWLDEQNTIGNPVTITYTKAEPTITPLPVAFDGLRKVEPGGYIEFITDNNKPIPVEVEFQVVGEA